MLIALMASDNYAQKWILKRLTLIVVFLTLTPIVLVLTVASLFVVNQRMSSESTIKTFFTPQINSTILSDGQELGLPSVYGEVVATDSRAKLLYTYLKKHKSDLSEYSEYIVQISDKYHLDYRLLVAIAQKESGLCRVIPEGSHNCWGWGIHSKGTLKFDNYEEALETVAKGLKENYVDKGYITIEQIMSKYAHSSSTTWAEGVINYMNQIR